MNKKHFKCQCNFSSHGSFFFCVVVGVCCVLFTQFTTLFSFDVIRGCWNGSDANDDDRLSSSSLEKVCSLALKKLMALLTLLQAY